MKNSTKTKKVNIYNRLSNERYILKSFKKEMGKYFENDVINKFTLNYIKNDSIGVSDCINYNNIRFFYYTNFFSSSKLENITNSDRFADFDYAINNNLIPYVLEHMLTIGDKEKVLTLRVLRDNRKIGLSVISRNLWKLRGTSSDCIQILCKIKRKPI